MEVKKHMNLLGHRAKDKITGFEGVVTSLSFDLYGCIMAAINPGLTSEGKLGDSHWFDVARLEVLSAKPVLDPPNFDYGPIAEGKHGPAEKPAFVKA